MGEHTHTHTHTKRSVLYFSASFQHMVCDGVAIAAFGSIYFLETIPGNARVSNCQTSSVSFCSFTKLDWNSVLFIRL